MNRWLGFVQNRKSKIKLINHYHKLFFVVLVATNVAISACGTQRSKSLRVGEIVPGFTLKDFSGEEHSLSQFAGKVILLDFWASWCPPCKASIPKLEEMSKEYEFKEDFMIIGINIDQSLRQATEFMNNNPISYLVLQGGKDPISQEYGIRGIPAFFLIDKEGKLIKQFTGYRHGIEDEWREEIDKLLN